MNIFVLDNDPKIAAEMQCDKHICKMLLESTQMLHTINSLFNLPHTYKPTHVNHPSTVWARASKQNWEWLFVHTVTLFEEYLYRYEKIHKCLDALLLFENVANRPSLPDIGLTTFAQAMPDQYKDPDAVKAYRAYYLGEKSRFAKWNKTRSKPEWWIETNNTKINSEL